ncbi:MAG: hypothetical protein MUO82_07130 [Candidatus Thermoplasmatota archaeon]|nr:hypothetical protein [Candidatus Thermoplasmatota archaeon]
MNNPKKIVDLGVASPEPLILKDVFYDFEFEIDQKIKLEKLENEIVSSIKKH